jgi:hypothetical protein
MSFFDVKKRHPYSLEQLRCGAMVIIEMELKERAAFWVMGRKRRGK